MFHVFGSIIPKNILSLFSTLHANQEDFTLWPLTTQRGPLYSRLTAKELVLYAFLNFVKVAFLAMEISS
jgi:hypothetical protein